MSITYATWNPSDKSANITLTNGNLTATTSGGAGNLVRSTIGVSSGKWYWEYNTFSMGMLMGISDGATSVNTDPGFSAGSYASYSDNATTKLKFNNSSSATYGIVYGPTATLGIALDMGAGTITLYINNVSQGVMYSGLTGTIYATVGQDTAVFSATANFGATALTYTPPSGFNAGLYSGSASVNSQFLAFM